jgi:DNA polymerase elongation subunit (family B)
MVTIEFFPLDAVQKIEGDKAVVYFYGVSGKKRVCVQAPPFDPYFLVLPKGKETEARLRAFSVKLDEREARIEHVEVVKRRLGFEQVDFLKCSTSIPQDVERLAREVKKLDVVDHVYEKDIRFTHRLMVDKGISPLQKHVATGEFVPGKNRARIFRADEIKPASDETYTDFKVMAFDIETPSREMDPSKHPILMIGVYSKGLKRVLTWKKFPTKTKQIEFLCSEKEMLERFGKILEEEDPDILCGYYSDGFDFPYIKARVDRLGAEFRPGFNFSSLRINGTAKKSAYIEGLLHIDVFKFLRYVWAQGLETTLYDLDSVSKELLKDGKYEVDIGQLGKVWDNGGAELEEFAKYNLKDCELAFGLCEKILPDIVEFVKLTSLTPFEMSRSRFSKLVEGYLISQAHQMGIVIPNLPGHDKIGERRRSSFQGAFVYEPRPGLYKDVAVFDYRSLYPSIISAHNISPETIKCDCCSEDGDRVPGRNDIWFCKKEKGFIPTVIKELITRRMRLKEIIKQQGTSRVMEARSHALKTLANAMWGYIGFFGSRWYSFEAALSITAYGRHYLSLVIEKAKKMGFEIIYGDTDSIFLDLKGKNIEEAKLFAEGINSELPDIMELQFEGFFPSALFVSLKDTAIGAKKKYAMIDKEGKMKITGFETVRRNWSLVAREAQRRVLEIVLKENDVEKARKYMIELVDRVRKGDIEKKLMIIKTQLTKAISEYESISPHVAVAKRLIDSGYKVQVGDLIEYVIVTGSGSVGNRAQPADAVEHPDYDTDYYVKNQIMPAVEGIFKELGVKPDDILSKKDQSELGKFF